MMFQHNTSPLLMMSLSVNEQWAIGTVMRGFKLWSVDGRQVKDTYIQDILTVSDTDRKKNYVFLHKNIPGKL